MPKELIESPALESAINSYRSTTGRKPYQPLSSLLEKLKSLCKSSIVLESGSLQPELK